MDYLRQIAPDWTTTPFVDIEVIDGWSCGEGKTEVFTRPWYGMSIACDCTGSCEIDLEAASWCYEMVPD